MSETLPDIPIRDIHLPEVVSWWVPAIGWWLVLGAILLTILAILMLRFRRSRRRYNRQATLEFENMYSSYQQALDPNIYVRELSVYLRKTAIHFYSRQIVAGLTGTKWLQFLDETSDHKTGGRGKKNSAEEKFQSDVGQLLLTVPYAFYEEITSSQVELLTRLTKSWLAKLPAGQTNSSD